MILHAVQGLATSGPVTSGLASESIASRSPAEDGFGTSFGVGLIGFLVIGAIAVVMVFLYRSMRRQLRRIDFNPDGQTDEERMSGHDALGDGGGAPDDVHGAEIDAEDDPNGHR